MAGQDNRAVSGLDSLRDALFEDALDAILIAEISGNVIAANAAAAQMFGWSRSELVGRPMDDTFIPDQYRDAHRNGMARRLKITDGATLNRRVKLEAQRRDGSIFPVELSLVESGLGDERIFVGHIRDLTEPDQAAHQRTVEELDQTRAQMSAFFQHAPFYAALNALDGRLVFASKTVADAYGVSAEELYAADRETLAQCWPEFERLAVAMAEVAESGEPQRLLTPFKPLATDNELLGDMTIFPIRAADGTIVQIGSLAVDITEHVKVRREAEDARATFQAFADNIPAGLTIKDRRRNFTMVNDFSARNFYALEPKDLVGKNAELFRTDRHGDHIYKMEEQVLETGIPESREVAYTAMDGQQHHMHLMFFPIVGEDGIATHIGSLTHDITEHRQAEAALAEREAQLTSLFEHVPADIAVFDKNQRAVMVNHSTSKAYDRESVDFVGTHPSEFREYWPEFDDVLATGMSVLQDGKSKRFKTSYSPPGKDELVYFDGIFFPIRSKSGEVEQVGLFLLDVTEQHRTEVKLAEQQANLLAFFNYAPLQVYVTDLDHKIVMVNDWVHRETGAEVFRPENVIGLSADQMVPSSWAEMSRDNDATVVGHGGVTQVKVRGQFGGKERDIISIRFPIKDAEGEVIRVGGFVVDVTEQESARRDEEKARATLKAFFDNLPGLAFLSSTDGIIIEANSFMAEEYGLPGMRSEDLIGKEGRKLLPKSWAAKVQEAIDANEQLGKSHRFNAELRLPDGVRHVSSVRFPVRNPEGELTHVGGLVFDRTAEKQASEDLLAARESLHQSEKLAALGQLLAGVSHELNNPLAAVIGQASLLAEDLEGTDHAERIAKIQRAADRCARIVQSFLAMARQKAPEHRLVSIHDLIKQALDLTEYQMRAANIALDVQLAETLPHVDADPDQLHQVIVNLLTNARQALDGNAEPRISISASAESGHVRLRIADNGAGIDDAARARIFDPFFTTKDIGSGTGLGLSYSLGIVEAHGGRLELEPSETGTIFCITLPVPEQAAQAAQPTQEELSRSKGRVLVVDDEADVAETLQGMLTRLGLEVTVALGGKAAQEALAGAAPFDMVVSDIRMPDIDGPELYAWIIQERPELTGAVAFVTGDTMSERVTEFLKHAECPVLEKPFNRAALDELIKRTIGP